MNPPALTTPQTTPTPPQQNTRQRSIPQQAQSSVTAAPLSSHLITSHLLHGLQVVDGERQVLRSPELVHDAAVVEVRGQHLQEPHELQGVLLQVEVDRLVVHLLVSDLPWVCARTTHDTRKRKREKGILNIMAGREGRRQGGQHDIFLASRHLIEGCCPRIRIRLVPRSGER